MRKAKIYARQASYEDFLEFVIRRGHLTQATLEAPHYDDTILRFCKAGATSLDLAASLRPSAYFSHSTAAFLNGLTASLPGALFLNVEQSKKPKPSASSLSQASLDRAFSSNQRQSKLFYTYETLTVTMLSGKNSEKLAVEPIAAPSGRSFSTTNLERTLVELRKRAHRCTSFCTSWTSLTMSIPTPKQSDFWVNAQASPKLTYGHCESELHP